MTCLKEMPVTQVIDYKTSRFIKSFYFQSDVLKKNNLQDECLIPIDFETDWESIPLFKGTSKVSGAIHDYLSRKDSIPCVTKKIAADVYKEFLLYRKTVWWRVCLKYWIVRLWKGYFHRLKVLDKLVIN